MLAPVVLDFLTQNKNQVLPGLNLVLSWFPKSELKDKVEEELEKVEEQSKNFLSTFEGLDKQLDILFDEVNHPSVTELAKFSIFHQESMRKTVRLITILSDLMKICKVFCISDMDKYGFVLS